MPRSRALKLLVFCCVASATAAIGDSNDVLRRGDAALAPWAGEAMATTDAASILPTAEPTIFLDVSGVQSTISVPSSVTFDPGFGYYYASGTGNTDRPAFVFGLAGGPPIHVEEPINIDARAWNFNSNTGDLEVVSYDAMSGGAGRGLIQAQVDGSGLLTGGTATLLASMPGNQGSQTSPAYNSGANVFYSRDASNLVSVVSRADGSQVSTITLDFAAAGVTSVPDDGIVFVPELVLLGVVDTTADTLSLFDLAGAFVTTVALPVDLTSDSRRPGYANGQLFVWDEAAIGWQGLRIVDQPLIQEIPTLSPLGFGALALLLAALALAALRRRAT